MSTRGAHINPHNRFLCQETVQEHIESIDDWSVDIPPTQYIEQEARSIVNKVESPDLPFSYSMNPYAGCEHGCVYCYARNAHEYLGYSAGVDFEQKIVVKKNAPHLLRRFLMHPKWDATPIMLSGNTDCYQPAEQTYRLTRRVLDVCREFGQPVSIITKNSYILKDLDVLRELSSRNLVSVAVSINTSDEKLRRVMEPRTTTIRQRMQIIEKLNTAGVRAGVMIGPVIPGLNDQDMSGILKTASSLGARFAGYTYVRLNGSVKLIFHEWLYRNFPDRADKVWHMIEDSHGGKVNDSRFGTRMKGEGKIPEMIQQQFKAYKKQFGFSDEPWSLNREAFAVPGRQGRLF